MLKTKLTKVYQWIGIFQCMLFKIRIKFQLRIKSLLMYNNDFFFWCNQDNEGGAKLLTNDITA